jgi:hypothetical protein
MEEATDDRPFLYALRGAAGSQHVHVVKIEAFAFAGGELRIAARMVDGW